MGPVAYEKDVDELDDTNWKGILGVEHDGAYLTKGDQ